VRYDECRPGEEVIHVVSTIGRKAASIKAGAEHSTSENIIEQCKQHLALLAEYRIQLYKLQDLPGVRQQSTPSLSGEVPDREAVETWRSDPSHSS